MQEPVRRHMTDSVKTDNPLRLTMNQDRKSPRSPAWNVHGYEIFENLGPFRTDRTPDLTVRGSLMWFPGGLTAILMIMRSWTFLVETFGHPCEFYENI